MPWTNLGGGRLAIGRVKSVGGALRYNPPNRPIA